jgi:pimeloyl-ACP methyl ester carboxylesterase
MLPTTVEIHQDGRRLRVARIGHGPPLVLLHGYPENLQIWCELAPRLSADFEVIAFDWPGMGYSDAWPGGATPIHQADRLRLLLDAWGIERAGIIAADMGGQPALVFGARYPERSEGLVIMNSLVQWDAPTSWEIRMLRRYRWNNFILSRLPRAVFLRAERTFLPRGSRLPPDLRADMWNSFKRPEVRRFIVRMCAGYQAQLPRLPGMAQHIACPVLILWAEHDAHFPGVQAEWLHSRITGSRLEIVPRTEHWMAWHRPAEVAQRIHAFAVS